MQQTVRGRHIRLFVFHKRDKSYSDAEHCHGTFNTNVLKILPADVVRLKKKSIIVLTCAAAIVVAEYCKMKMILSPFPLLVASEGDQLASHDGSVDWPN